MFIKVLPLDISFSDEALTYYIKEDQKKYINIWSIVSIPIKNRISSGVVSEIMKIQDIESWEIKSIIEILCSFSIIDKYQIDLIFSLSSKYFLPIHKVLNLFLPKFILNRLEKNAFQDILEIPEIQVRNKNENCRNNPIFLHNINSISLDLIFNENIWDLEDCVIIFWDDFWIGSFIENNKKYQSEWIIYKNSDSYSKKYRNFLDILSKKKNIIFWTRKLLQYNLSAYKKIIYLEDSMVKYNYNQFEKYKNLDILNYINLSKKFEIYFISTIPSIELFYLSKINNYNYRVV